MDRSDTRVQRKNILPDKQSASKTAAKTRVPQIVAEMTAEQAAIVGRFAAEFRATPGQFVAAAALAFLEMMAEPDQSQSQTQEHAASISAALFEFGGQKKLPDVTDGSMHTFGWGAKERAVRAAPASKPDRGPLMVEPSERQREVFDELAEAGGATAAQVVLALACDRLQMSFIYGDYPATELRHMLWPAVAMGDVPATYEENWHQK